MPKGICPLCNEATAGSPEGKAPELDVLCENCGHFRVTEEAHAQLQHIPNEEKFCLGSWVYGEYQRGTTPLVDEKQVSSFKAFPHPGTQQRVEMYLKRAIRLVGKRLAGRVHINHPALRIASWSFSHKDAHALASHLVKLGAFCRQDGTDNYQLVAQGHILHEQWANRRAATSQAFLAMWFDPQMTVAYEQGFRIGIEGAGYKALRIDRKDHDRKIDDEIVAEIRRSAFVVADFSGHRGGVYYEAGFAHGLGRRVIFTCCRDEIDKIHFDVRQYNTILWQSPDEVVAPLQNRILALFGAGPLNLDARPLPM
jgi:hypothetical protein